MYPARPPLPTAWPRGELQTPGLLLAAPANPQSSPQAVPGETPPPFAEHSPGAGAETFRSAPARSRSRHHAAPTHLTGSLRRTRTPQPASSSRPDTGLPPSLRARPRLASPPRRGGGSRAGAWPGRAGATGGWGLCARGSG